MVNVGGGVPDAPQADADSAPYNLPHGRGRALRGCERRTTVE